jgi:hypothetical protein
MLNVSHIIPSPIPHPSLLESGDLPNVKLYAVEEDKILFVCNSEAEVMKLQKWVLAQDEIDYWEREQKLYFPAGRDGPLTSDEERKRKAKDLQWDRLEIAEAEKKKKKKTIPVSEEELRYSSGGGGGGGKSKKAKSKKTKDKKKGKDKKKKKSSKKKAKEEL